MEDDNENNKNIHKALNEVREMMQSNNQELKQEVDEDVLELAGLEVEENTKPEKTTEGFIFTKPQEPNDSIAANEESSPLEEVNTQEPEAQDPVEEYEETEDTEEELEALDQLEEYEETEDTEEELEAPDQLEKYAETKDTEEELRMDPEIDNMEALEQNTINNSNLISQKTAEESKKTIRSLLDKLDKPVTTEITNSANAGLLVEDLVKELLRPYISEWLDRNLHEIVKDIIEKEVKKLIPKDTD